MRSIFPFTLLGLISLLLVRADTEIRNFHVPSTHPTPATPPTSVLNLGPTSTLQINHTTPELWIRIPLTEGDWTARLSWPGSTPTRFDVAVYPWPHEDTPNAKSEGDGALLHITAEALSPRIRHPLLYKFGLASDPESVAPDHEFYTTFNLLVEPVYAGVLPATAVSAVIAIGVMVVLAIFAAPNVLQGILDEGKKESKKIK